MADIELVIKIPEIAYENTKRFCKLSTINDDELAKAIANGIPLPEGHGKLIIEPTDEEIAKTIGGKNDFAECIREAVKAVFDNAPAVIEADAPKRKKGTPIEENDNGYNCENWIP